MGTQRRSPHQLQGRDGTFWCVLQDKPYHPLASPPTGRQLWARDRNGWPNHVSQWNCSRKPLVHLEINKPFQKIQAANDAVVFWGICRHIWNTYAKTFSLNLTTCAQHCGDQKPTNMKLNFLATSRFCICKTGLHPGIDMLSIRLGQVVQHRT